MEKTDLGPGTMVDHFKVVGLVGRGGMGEVYLARDTKLGRKVALKLVHPDALGDQEAVERFLHEARTTARFSHPHIVQVHFVGEHEGRPYVALEYLEGETLRDRLEERRPSPKETIRMGLAIAEALAEAHEHGVLHRDLKPENVMLPKDGRLRVVDFGLAKNVVVQDDLTTADTVDLDSLRNASTFTKGFETEGRLMGTPLYMAPEQWTGDEPTGALDVWALGMMLAEMLASEHPYAAYAKARPLAALAATVCSGQPVPFRGPSSNVPDGSLDLVRRCLAKDGAQRPTAAATAAALRELAQRHADPRQEPASTASPAPQRSPMVPTNLHAETTSFVGRRAELARLQAEMLAGWRLVTILGPGGTGKTRFARQAGRRLMGSFPEGVWFCDLAEARDQDGICSAVAAALDVPLGSSPAAQLSRAIAVGGHALFILDNFEQVVALAGDTVGRWMTDAPEASFLVTSRELLGMAGEQAFPLEPLLTPAAGTARARDVAEFDAVELFVTRARAAQPSFALTDDNASSIAELTRQLDGLPLAVELAASRTRMLSPAGMLERLHRRFELLRSSRRDACPRQATLRATLDWSWNLLDPCEQLALAQCAVFQGGFDLDAAERVLDLGDDPAVPPPLDVLQALVDKSLLRVGPSTAPGGGATPAEGPARFGMLVSVQEYALERLTLAAERQRDAGQSAGATEAAAAIHRRHAEYYAELGDAERLLELETDPTTSALDRLALERDNLWAALSRMGQSGRADLAGRCCLALQGLFERIGPQRAAATAYEKLPPPGTMSDDVHSRVLLAQAATESRIGAATAAETASSAVELAERLGRADTLARALAIQARALLFRMNHAGARKTAERAVRVAEQSGNVDAQIAAAMVLGIVLHSEASETVAAAPVLLARRSGRHRQLGIALGNYAVWTSEGRGVAEALPLLEEAIAIAHRLKAKLHEGHQRAARAIFLNNVDRTDEALPEARAALRLLRPLHTPRSEAMAFEALGRCQLAHGELEEARTAIDQAIRLCRGIGEEMELVRHLSAKAEVEAACANRAAALQALEEAETYAARNPVQPQSNWGKALARARRRVRNGEQGQCS